MLEPKFLAILMDEVYYIELLASSKLDLYGAYNLSLFYVSCMLKSLSFLIPFLYVLLSLVFHFFRFLLVSIWILFLRVESDRLEELRWR